MRDKLLLSACSKSESGQDTLTSTKCLKNISAPLTASLAGAARKLTSVGEDEAELSFEPNQITTNVPPSPEPARQAGEKSGEPGWSAA